MDEKKDRILQIRDYFCNGNNREFAKKLNMSEQYASNMTHGTKNISATFLNKILDAFPDVDRTTIFDAKQRQNKPKTQQNSDLHGRCCFWRASNLPTNLPTFAHFLPTWFIRRRKIS